jgi:myo-inositol 2-dehydrogenase/D-chiro-inositol 1-dehydrogenase
MTGSFVSDPIYRAIATAGDRGTTQGGEREMSEVAKLALCGFGRAGRIHFRGIRNNPRCELKYIVDCFEDAAVLKSVRAVLEEYRMLDTVRLVKTSEYESVVLADGELDGVVITAPTQYHESYVKRALVAKKAVFCEKPLAYELEDIFHCYDLAERSGLPLYCAFQRRFDPGMSKLRHSVAEGKLGKVFQVKSTSRDSPKPTIEYLKTSGGMYHDTAVHDIDMLCWIVGEEPAGVFAQGSVFDPEIAAIGDVDTIAVTLKFPSGVLAVLDLSRHSNYGYDMRLEAFGEKGVLLCENVREDPCFHYTSSGSTASQVQHSFPQRFEVAYKREMDHFVDMILDPETQCAVTREDVVLCTRVANACERSQREGKMVGLEPIPRVQQNSH